MLMILISLNQDRVMMIGPIHDRAMRSHPALDLVMMFGPIHDRDMWSHPVLDLVMIIGSIHDRDMMIGHIHDRDMWSHPVLNLVMMIGPIPDRAMMIGHIHDQDMRNGPIFPSLDGTMICQDRTLIVRGQSKTIHRERTTQMMTTRVLKMPVVHIGMRWIDQGHDRIIRSMRGVYCDTARATRMRSVV